MEDKNVDNADLPEAGGDHPESEDEAEFISKPIDKMNSKLFVEGRWVPYSIADCHIKLSTFFYSYDNWISIREKRIQTLLERENEVKNLDRNLSEDSSRIISAVSAERNWRGVFSIIINAWSLIYNYFRNERRSGIDKRLIYYKLYDEHKKDYYCCQELYELAVECYSQFRVTRQNIEEFYSLIKKEENLELLIEDPHVLEFLTEISRLNPMDSNTFYKWLRFHYEKLLKNCATSESKNFVKAFEKKPEAIQVINLLSWKFKTEGINFDAIKTTQIELDKCFSPDEKFDPEICHKKILDYIQELRDEKEVLEFARSELELLRNHTYKL